MANFTANISEGVTTSDGISLSRSLTGQNLNAKELLDDSFASGVIDLTPYFASIADPKFVLILADGDGFKVNFDALGASTKAYKSIMLEVTPNTPGPSGVLTLAIDAQGVAQRIRVIALGD